MLCKQCQTTLDEDARFCGACGSFVAFRDPLVGRTLLGQYTLQERLGEGAYGAVYRAEQPSLRRFVAVKVLHKHLTLNPNVVARFQREGMAASALTHPSVVKMYNIGATEDGYVWLAMEFLEGQTLSDYLKERLALSPEETITLLTPISQALHEAHQKGIIHRDLKPENIFLARSFDGGYSPKLLDFGISGILSESSDASSVVSGTPPYMPPEQWRGLKYTDARSDIYALGVIAYQCLCARLPFDADTAPAWMHRHHFEAPLALSVLRSDLPPHIQRAVLRALEKNPDNRPQSALQLIEELKNPASPAIVTKQKEPTSIEWISLQSNTRDDLLSLCKGDLFYAVGANGVVLSSTDGNSWKRKASATPEFLWGVCVGPQGEVYAAGDEGAIVSSFDQGKTWRLEDSQSNECLRDMICSNGLLFCVGANGTILRSSLGSNLWGRLTSNTLEDLLSITSDPNGILCAVGKGGTMILSNDFGQSWNTVQTHSQEHLLQAFWAPWGDIFVVGASGTILYSSDYGGTWRFCTVPCSQNLWGVYGDEKAIYAVGKDGVILQSTNRGGSWIQINSGSTEWLTGVFVDANGVIVIGGNGLILRQRTEERRQG